MQKKLTERELFESFTRASTTVANRHYPKDDDTSQAPSASGRGRYLADQALLYALLVQDMRSQGFIAD